MLLLFTGEDGGSCVVGEEVDSHESNPVYRCESCGLRLESLKRFMDHRNFDCVAGRTFVGVLHFNISSLLG